MIYLYMLYFGNMFFVNMGKKIKRLFYDSLFNAYKWEAKYDCFQLRKTKLCYVNHGEKCTQDNLVEK